MSNAILGFMQRWALLNTHDAASIGQVGGAQPAGWRLCKTIRRNTLRYCARWLFPVQI